MNTSWIYIDLKLTWHMVTEPSFIGKRTLQKEHGTANDNAPNNGPVIEQQQPFY
jgi:hypothetical protein